MRWTEGGRRRGRRWQMFPETGAGESCYRRCSADGKERNGRGDSRQPNRDRAPNDAQPLLRRAGEKIGRPKYAA